MPLQTTYLVGIVFHEPDAFAAWNRGTIEDYESSTGVFVDAASREEAIAWGEVTGEALLRFVNRDSSLDRMAAMPATAIRFFRDLLGFVRRR
jgi:hypothetical protein